MAQEHLNNLITAAGIDAADIEAIMALPAEGEQDLTPYTGKIHAAAETQLKNDPNFWESLDENNVNEEFKKRIEAQQFGRAVNISRQKILQATGLKEEDLGEMTEDEKRNLKTYVSKVFDKYASTKVSDKQLQSDLMEARKKAEELETSIPTREAEIKQTYEAKGNDDKLDFIFLAELAKISADKDTQLKVPISYIIKELSATLKDQNAFSINGIEALPRQKANPNLAILDGSKEVTLKDLIIKKLKADNLISEAAAPAGPTRGTTTVDVNPDGKGNLGISADVMAKIAANMPTGQ